MFGFFEKAPKSDPSYLTFLAVDDNLETNVRGMYVAGDLSGTPLLKNAVNMGHDVVGRIAAGLRENSGADYDVIICGAGPAGIAAAVRAKDLGLSYIVLEQYCLASTLSNFPPAKPLYTEPEEMETKSRLWLRECETKELLERWKSVARDEKLDIRLMEEVKDVRRTGDHFTVETAGSRYTGQRVILSIGKQGNPRRLGVPGEELDKVSNRLIDPEKYEGMDILVAGAGDSAAETALLLCDNNNVSLAVRGGTIIRPRQRNIDSLMQKQSEGKLDILYETTPAEIKKHEVVLNEKGGGEKTLKNDYLFAMLGSDPPYPFLKKIGVKIVGEWDARRYAWFVFFLSLVVFYYMTKGGYRKFSFLPEWAVDFFRAMNETLPPWWGAGLYTLFVAVFGVYYIFKKQARHYRFRRYLQMRNLSCIFFQGFFFFVLPEIIMNSGKYYSLAYVWPLTLSPVNQWAKALAGNPDVFWAGWTFFLAFAGMPVFVYYHGKRYCSWICGCGALAETAGEPFRSYAPKGLLNRRKERVIYIILAWAVIMTAAGLLKPFVAPDFSTMKYAYWVVVVFLFSGIIGIGMYPFFGNRIWCRYGCPLAAYMNLLGAVWSKYRISSNDKCIDCGQCNRYCEMGIDIKGFAMKKQAFSVRNTPCIACGECIAVCPMDVLRFGDQPANENNTSKT